MADLEKALGDRADPAERMSARRRALGYILVFLVGGAINLVTFLNTTVACHSESQPTCNRGSIHAGVIALGVVGLLLGGGGLEARRRGRGAVGALMGTVALLTIVESLLLLAASTGR